MEQEDEETCLRECQDKCKRGNVREDKEMKNGAKPITVIDIDELDFDSEASDKDKDRQRQVNQLEGGVQPGEKLEETVVDQSIERLALDGLGHIEESTFSRNRNENWSENFEWLEPGASLPLLEAPLPTGVACCLTRY